MKVGAFFIVELEQEGPEGPHNDRGNKSKAVLLGLKLSELLYLPFLKCMKRSTVVQNWQIQI